MVRDRGWACSEWVGAGAAGEANAAEGVAGESSMLPCEDAGLSMVFSWGRYCTHCFLLRAEKSEREEQERRQEKGTKARRGKKKQEMNLGVVLLQLHFINTVRCPFFVLCNG